MLRERWLAFKWGALAEGCKPFLPAAATLFISGCLINFSPFDEATFLDEYEAVLCDLYVDCLDGTADGTQSINDPATAHLTCSQWVKTPNNQGCSARESQAISCYDEVVSFAEAVRLNDTCDSLWMGSIMSGDLASCASTYLDCTTDSPFGTVPPATGIPGTPPSMDTVHPLHGPDDGGTIITITGSGFDAATLVYIGRTEASILEYSPNMLVVSSPRLVSGSYEITIENENGSAQSASTFTAYPEANGAGGFGYMYATRNIGSYWNGDAGLAVGMYFLFLNGSDGREPLQFYDLVEKNATPGNCYDYSAASPVTLDRLQTGYNEVAFGAGSTTHTGISQGDYFEGNWSEAAPPTRTYNLIAPQVDGWPAFELESLFRFPSAPNIISPAMAGSDLPRVDPTDFNIRWSSSGSSDSYIYTILMNQESGAQSGCVWEDSGMVMIEPEWLLDAGDGNRFVIQMCRAQSNVSASARSPINNGPISATGLNCVMGAVRLEMP